MGFADNYFVRFQAELAPESQQVPDDLGLAVVLPAYNEPDIEDTLISLLHNDDPGCVTDVILVVNAPDDDSKQSIARNLTDFQHYSEFAKTLEHPFIRLTVLWKTFSKKHAGPGSARKYGMDIALDRFNRIDNANGVILSLDADAVVAKNYLKAVHDHFKNYPEQDATTVYFEHPYQEDDDPIILYELYLRYFRHALQWSGYPHYFYFVGSCFAVKVSAYAEQGGMNRKNAGEDFYFLNKIELNGNLGECNNTFVYPSDRISDRVPFGTGPEVKKIKATGSYDVYSMESFELLSKVVQCIDNTYGIEKSTYNDLIKDLPEPVITWMKKIYLCDHIQDAHKNTTGKKAYFKRLYRYVDTFKIIRFLNYISETLYPKSDVKQESAVLADKLGIPYEDNAGVSLLETYRKHDKFENH
ncbi:MAG: glycosyltransferase [Bacteroidota bacterium]|nr:glycosyltransferase [Bacteroidota bacterium]